VKAPPASEISCPGCERQCTKEVEVSPAEDNRQARALVVCDEPEDMGLIPVELNALKQWKISGEALAGALAKLLGLTKSPRQDRTGKRWGLGLINGKRHKGEIRLAVIDGVTLSLAGHVIPVSEVLTLDGNGVSADKMELVRLVDKPASSPNASLRAASTARREVRKQRTLKRYAVWRNAARALRRKPQGRSERWVALQIAEMAIADGASAETIRRNLRL
jgi:hypothetical protein